MENTPSPAEPINQARAEETDRPWSFVKHTHEYLHEFVRSSDQKAAFLLVAGTALFGLLYREPPAGDCLKWVKLIALVFTATSVAFSAWVVKPRQRDEKNGLVSWEGIHGSKRPYRERVRELSNEQLVDELTNHCERLAAILHDKYNWLYRAVLLFLVGGAISVAFFLVQYWQHPLH